jgi:hypothetical protein
MRMVPAGSSASVLITLVNQASVNQTFLVDLYAVEGSASPSSSASLSEDGSQNGELVPFTQWSEGVWDMSQQTGGDATVPLVPGAADTVSVEWPLVDENGEAVSAGNQFLVCLEITTQSGATVAGSTGTWIWPLEVT